jgi:hypothetical protein
MGVGDGRSGYRVLTINRLLALFVFLARCLLLIEDCDKLVKPGGIIVGDGFGLDVIERGASFFL